MKAGTLLFLVIVWSHSFAQQPESLPDTTQIAQDTTLTDTARAQEGVDTVITYSADQIDFDVTGRSTILSGNAKIEYKNMTLEAGQIEVNWDEQTLIASELPDTIFTDSAKTEIDTILMTGRPHFVQGQDDFTGTEIAYNMKTKVGRVRGGRTAYQDGRYYGEQFKRVAEDVITVKNGEFTTCELDPPHYHFAADRLKILVGDRVIARPVYIYFDDVPVMAAPYGIFPVQKDRTSGLLIPTFGESAAQGRFLRNIGYYWAPSQYMDAIGSIDYFERFGVLGRGEFRYAKRYILDGSLRYEFDTQRFGQARNNRYRIGAAHNQIFDPNTRFALSADYVSDRSFNDDVGTIQDQLAQSVQSNATLTKSWDNSPWTASGNLRYVQNIRLNTWNATAPAIQFTHKLGRLFPPPKAPRRIRNAVAPKESRPPWYRTFTWTYATNYRNELNFPRTGEEELLILHPPDSLGNTRTPTRVFSADTTILFERDGLSHDGNVAATARVLKYLNLNPTFRWKSAWVRRTVNYEILNGDTLARADENQFAQRTTFDIGSSATTKLYGLARRPFGIGADFRHVATPRVSFTYRPDFSDKEWGYFRTITLPDGRTFTYDRFSSTEMASNIGGTPRGISELLGFSLENLFQMKSGDPEEATEKKYDLLSWNLDTGVDFKKDSLRWSDLTMSFRTAIPGRIIGPLQGMGFNLRTTHSFYQQRGGIRIDEFYWDRPDAKWYSPFELTFVTANVDFALRAKTFGSLFGIGTGMDEEITVVDTTGAQEPYTTLEDITDYRASLPPSPKERQEGPPQFYEMPFDLSVGFYRTENFIANTRTSTMNSRFDLTLTERWSASTTYAFDLDRKVPTNVDVSITRDLHCWEAQLTWSPAGLSPGYYLRIGLRSPQLRDVKVERERGRSNLGSFR